MLALAASGAIVLGVAGVVALLSAAHAAASNYEPAWPHMVLTVALPGYTALAWASAKLGSLIARYIEQRS